MLSATLLVGVAAILGTYAALTTFDITLTPTLRYRSGFALSCVVVGCALCVRLQPRPGRSKFELPAGRPVVLLAGGFAIGSTQSFTAVTYLAWLTMLSTSQPHPVYSPVLVVIYGIVALTLPLIVLASAALRGSAGQCVFAALTRGVIRFGPAIVRIISGAAGLILVGDALVHAHGTPTRRRRRATEFTSAGPLLREATAGAEAGCPVTANHRW